MQAHQEAPTPFPWLEVHRNVIDGLYDLDGIYDDAKAGRLAKGACAPRQWSKRGGLGGELIEHVARGLGVPRRAIVRTSPRGGSGGSRTFAHWKVAIAYAGFVNRAPRGQPSPHTFIWAMMGDQVAGAAIAKGGSDAQRLALLDEIINRASPEDRAQLFDNIYAKSSGAGWVRLVRRSRGAPTQAQIASCPVAWLHEHLGADGMIDLDQLYAHMRAAGMVEVECDPYRWFKEDGDRIARAVEESMVPIRDKYRISKASRSRGGGAFGNWEVAMWYAYFINPTLHEWAMEAAVMGKNGDPSLIREMAAPASLEKMAEWLHKRPTPATLH